MCHKIVPELAQRNGHHLLPSSFHFKPNAGFWKRCIALDNDIDNLRAEQH